MSQQIANLSTSRARLASVLRAAKNVISIDVTATTLDLDRSRAAQLLARWQRQGWLRRVGPGVYVPVPLDLADSTQVVADPWVLVPALFGDCYVGGWTAAHHWELTEQLFNQIVVFSARRVTSKHVEAQGVTFLLQHIGATKLFGLKTLWRGSAKVAISDAARTLIDLLDNPAIGGGIDHVAECLATYIASKNVNRDLLIHYAERFRNGAVFKRLGYLAETHLHDFELSAACRQRLTAGYARLDPSLDCSTLVTAWHLWVPKRWKYST